MEIRLQKYLADCGVASRRKCEEIILSGRVEVDGEIVDTLGTKVDPSKSKVTVNGKLIKDTQDFRYILLHKPEGFITTAKDQFDRPSVIDIIEDCDERIYPVGRLDYDTSGLLLLTNDGDLTFKLTHPKHNVEKTYIARIAGIPDEDAIESLRSGVYIDGYKTARARVDVVKTYENSASVRISIKEGKNRQVRKMFSSVGHEVIALKRVATGNLFLGELKRGEYRDLTDDEVKYLKNL